MRQFICVLLHIILNDCHEKHQLTYVTVYSKWKIIYVLHSQSKWVENIALQSHLRNRYMGSLLNGMFQRHFLRAGEALSSIRLGIKPSTIDHQIWLQLQASCSQFQPYLTYCKHSVDFPNKLFWSQWYMTCYISLIVYGNLQLNNTSNKIKEKMFFNNCLTVAILCR